MRSGIKIKTPLTEETIKSLRAGDTVFISGTIYTARDAAHKRIAAMLLNGEELPFSIENQTVYYAGPCPAPPGYVTGPIGPTTSGRMDAYSPDLIGRGLKAMIGKGSRSEEVIDAIKRHTGIYFAAVGGAAALIAKSVKSVKVIAFEDLGAEAVRELRVEDFPAVVAVDCYGGNLYTMLLHKA